MKRIIYFLIIALNILDIHYLRSEYIYLKDGTVVEGAITSETSESMTVKTKVQTLTFKQSEIKRVLYGQREMEEIFILLDDGSLFEGYLVDQDASEVTVRKNKDSAKEITYKKASIRQISPQKIFLLQHQFFFRFGSLSSINSGGGKLDSAPAFYGGYSLIPPFLPWGRALFELGYSEMGSVNNKKFSYRQIPLSASYLYFYPLNYDFLKPLKMKIDAVGKFKLGFDFAFLNNGEGENYSGIHFLFGPAIGLCTMAVPKFLQVFLFVDYDIIMALPRLLHNVSFNIGAGYLL